MVYGGILVWYNELHLLSLVLGWTMATTKKESKSVAVASRSAKDNETKPMVNDSFISNSTAKTKGNVYLALSNGKTRTKPESQRLLEHYMMKNDEKPTMKNVKANRGDADSNVSNDASKVAKNGIFPKVHWSQRLMEKASKVQYGTDTTKNSFTFLEQTAMSSLDDIHITNKNPCNINRNTQQTPKTSLGLYRKNILKEDITRKKKNQEYKNSLDDNLPLSYKQAETSSSTATISLAPNSALLIESKSNDSHCCTTTKSGLVEVVRKAMEDNITTYNPSSDLPSPFVRPSSSLLWSTAKNRCNKRRRQQRAHAPSHPLPPSSREQQKGNHTETATTPMPQPILNTTTTNDHDQQSSCHNSRFFHIINSTINNDYFKESISDHDDYASTQKERKIQKQLHSNHENYVRLNLRNTHGTCRRRRTYRATRNTIAGLSKDRQLSIEEEDTNQSNQTSPSYRPCITSNMIVDPLDDYMDGALHRALTSTYKEDKHKQDDGLKNSTLIKKKAIAYNSSLSKDQGYPKCIRHGRTCQLLTVKKGNTGNRGRKFFVCSLPRGEQCNFFQWEEDTEQAAQTALQRGSTVSNFISRQVASHAARYKQLTLPELRTFAKKHGLRYTGKKQDVITRILIWVRDEISRTFPTVAMVESTIDDKSIRIDDDILDDKENPTVKLSLTEEQIYNTEEDAKEDVEGDDGYLCLTDDDEETTDISTHCSTDSDTSTRDTELEKSSNSNPRVDHPAENNKLLKILWNVFGYKTFRPGQQWAIQQCLDQKRSLLVAPTGFGKSLCYALPALMMEGLTIVVSPLISLMQVRKEES